MSAHQAIFPVAVMSRVLGVSVSGFHAWRCRPPSAHAIADTALLKQIRTVHASSRETYGAPRVQAALKAGGEKHGRKRIARLMRAAGLVGASRPRSGVTTTRRDKEARPAPDLVDRNFVASRPNQLWVADITFVATASGFLYLAVVLDAWSRKLVGWSMANHLRTELVLDALDMAIGQRRPHGVIHHSDQGSPVYLAGIRQTLQGSRRAAVDGIGRRRLRQRDVRELLRDPRVRVAGTSPLCVASRGEDGLLQLHRRLVQPGAAAFRPRLPLAHSLRTCDGGPTNGSVVNQARQHSTKPGQLQTTLTTEPAQRLLDVIQHRRIYLLARSACRRYAARREPGSSIWPRSRSSSISINPLNAIIARRSGRSR